MSTTRGITVHRGGSRIDDRGVLRLLRILILNRRRALARTKFYVPHPLLTYFSAQTYDKIL